MSSFDPWLHQSNIVIFSGVWLYDLRWVIRAKCVSLHILVIYCLYQIQLFYERPNTVEWVNIG